MKITLKLILTTSMLALSMLGYATEEYVQQICAAITASETKGLNNLFDSTVEISILGESLVCNKDYAVNAVSDFVNNNQKSVCKVSHYGKRENSSFCIISIASAGKSYRLYALFRKVSDKKLIQQFRIDDVTE